MFASSSLSGLFPELGVEFLFNPFFVVRRVGAGGFLKDEAGQVSQLVDEIEQLSDVVGDRRTVGVDALQVLLEDLADSLDAFGDRLEIGISARFRLLRRLHQKDRVSHFQCRCHARYVVTRFVVSRYD